MKMGSLIHARSQVLSIRTTKNKPLAVSASSATAEKYLQGSVNTEVQGHHQRAGL
jgi:hypothetical protein